MSFRQVDRVSTPPRRSLLERLLARVRRSFSLMAASPWITAAACLGPGEQAVKRAHSKSGRSLNFTQNRACGVPLGTQSWGPASVKRRGCVRARVRKSAWRPEKRRLEIARTRSRPAFPGHLQTRRFPAERWYNLAAGRFARVVAMGFFRCAKCGCEEDTALCNYWSARIQETPPLCSACDPKIRRWHGQFARKCRRLSQGGSAEGIKMRTKILDVAIELADARKKIYATRTQTLRHGQATAQATTSNLHLALASAARWKRHPFLKFDSISECNPKSHSQYGGCSARARLRFRASRRTGVCGRCIATACGLARALISGAFIRFCPEIEKSDKEEVKSLLLRFGDESSTATDRAIILWRL
jgi:hypothetical protein